jgi:transforming growth factor-beta-induced protein
MFKLVLFVLTTFALLTACAPGALYGGSSTVNVKNNSALGNHLTATNSFTLYTFANDVGGVSNCNGDCATTWPPLLETNPVSPAGLGGSLTTIARADGSQQVAYNGQLLYFFSGDKNPGDTNGQGIGGVWFVAKAVTTTSSSNNSNDSNDNSNSSGSTY